MQPLDIGVDLDRLDHRISHSWHCAINDFNTPLMGSGKWRHWMYEAKRMADEIPRMTYWFKVEREGKMPQVHQQCSRSPQEQVQDNHLSCCLGVECRKCPELLALEKADMAPERIDEAKAWTCAAHIVSQGGDHMGEGYLLTVGDRMYWDTLHESLAAGLEVNDSTTGDSRAP